MESLRFAVRRIQIDCLFYIIWIFLHIFKSASGNRNICRCIHFNEMSYIYIFKINFFNRHAIIMCYIKSNAVFHVFHVNWNTAFADKVNVFLTIIGTVNAFLFRIWWANQLEQRNRCRHLFLIRLRSFYNFNALFKNNRNIRWHMNGIGNGVRSLFQNKRSFSLFLEFLHIRTNGKIHPCFFII